MNTSRESQGQVFDPISNLGHNVYQGIAHTEQHISDLKFFEDLMHVPVPVTISPEKTAQMQQLQQLQQLQTENAHFAQTILKQSSSRLQSELLDSKHLLQEEISRRERAEAHNKESDGRCKVLEEKVVELEGNLDEMKWKKFKLSSSKKGKKGKWGDMMLQFEQFEKEKNELARKYAEELEASKFTHELTRKLTEELEASQVRLKETEARFHTENNELDEKCQELEGEIWVMEDQRKYSLEELEKVHEKIILELQTTLSEKSQEANELLELNLSMEELIKMHHKKARAAEESFDMEKNELEESCRELEKDVKLLKDKVLGMDDKRKKSLKELKKEHKKSVLELHNALSEKSEEVEELVKMYQEESEALLLDMQVMENELDDKDAQIEEMAEQLTEMAENPVSKEHQLQFSALRDELSRTITSAKAKEHQFMRDKKKWSTIENSLRDEMKSIKERFGEVADESKNLKSERGGLDDAFRRTEKENEYLKEKLSAMKIDLEETYEALESVEDESMSRIKSLEQELVRANTMASSTSSPRSVTEMSDLKNALRSKDEAIRHVKELARESMHEVEELKQMASRASPSRKPTIDNGAIRSYMRNRKKN